MFDGTNTSFSYSRTSAQSVAVPSRLQPPAFVWLTGHAQSDLEVTQLLRFQKCVSWREAALRAWQFLCGDRESHSGLCPAPPKEHGSDPIQKQALPSHAEKDLATRCRQGEAMQGSWRAESVLEHWPLGHWYHIRWLREKRDTRCAVHNIWTKAYGSSEES